MSKLFLYIHKKSGARYAQYAHLIKSTVTFINETKFLPYTKIEVFTMEPSSRPLDSLNAARAKKVIVELKNGKQYLGKLKAFDIHINIVLEEAEERVNGETSKKLGTLFLRGDAIIYICPN